MESRPALPKTDDPENCALQVLKSLKISGPLVHALFVAKDHFQLKLFSDLDLPYILYQHPEGRYVLHLNEYRNEAETRFACALGLGGLFITPPEFREDTSTDEDKERLNALIYRFALAFVIPQAHLAEDCAGREITPDLIHDLVQRYGVPKVIMENCLVHRGYMTREQAPAPEGYFADFIPRRFRLSP
jgi:Zn-dependent peptidase ImmA (M78 family)